MDKYEYKVRADEIKQLIAEGSYAQAAEIADTIDWRKVKSVMMLCTISDLYKINRRYEEARDLLLLAYEQRPGGRTICYSLCELSVKMEDYVQAVEYYKEFVQVAPSDPGRYILQYKIYVAQEVSLEERIEVLEELKKRDYREKWAYELAYLYHRVGLATRCVEECDEMILWFGEGRYVIKAMELKMLHQPLTPEQQERYDHRFDEPEEEYPAEGGEAEYEQQDVPSEDGGQDPLQDTRIYDSSEREVIEEYVKQDIPPEDGQPEEPEIRVKTMDMGRYNTMNLQAELAAGLREVLEEDGGQQPEEAAEPEYEEEAQPEEFAEPEYEEEAQPEEFAEPEYEEEAQPEEATEPELGEGEEEIESTEVFFGETGEIGSLLQEARQLRRESSELEQMVMTAQPPKEMAGVLAQDSDGQISLVMPESGKLEKQITGQMSIEDILTEWEKVKKENQEKREQEVRKLVLEQTGDMFTEFEAAARDGLLEKLEKDEDLGEDIEIASEEAAEDAVTAEDTVEELEEIQEDGEAELEEEIYEEDGEAELEEEIYEEDGEAELEEEIYEEDGEAELEEEIYEEDGEAEPEEEIYEEDAEPEPEEDEPKEEETPEKAEEVSEEAAEKEEPKAPEETSDEQEDDEEEESAGQDGEKVRKLTREEKELYAPFIQSKASREQLAKAIDAISMASYTGNLVITGEEGMDILTLAKNVVRELQASDSNFSGKVAKISGSNLNKRDVAETLGQLQNGALIVEKASEMDANAVQKLYQALQKENMGIVVILEDTKKRMNRFLKEQEKLSGMFTARIDVEAMSNDALVSFGKQYARELEYSIDDLGILALHTRIEDLQTSDHVATVIDVREIMDEAISHAKRKTLGHFFDILVAKRYDEEDMIILSEKDFV